jgi:hypothetical protein
MTKNNTCFFFCLEAAPTRDLSFPYLWPRQLLRLFLTFPLYQVLPAPFVYVLAIFVGSMNYFILDYLPKYYGLGKLVGIRVRQFNFLTVKLRFPCWREDFAYSDLSSLGRLCCARMHGPPCRLNRGSRNSLIVNLGIMDNSHLIHLYPAVAIIDDYLRPSHGTARLRQPAISTGLPNFLSGVRDTHC